MSVAAVIVTWNPPEGLEKRLANVRAQVDRLIIVDNGSDEATKTILRSLPGVEIIWNTENRGLAAALNQGIQAAEGAEWILLLDHDSAPAPDMVAQLRTAYGAYKRPESIAVVAPEIVEQNAPAPTRYLAVGKFGFRRMRLSEPVNDEAVMVITSGSLIKTAVLRETGLMPEHFFIDYIDHAFCLRLRALGYKILLVKGARLYHRLGEKQRHAGVIVASHHSAKRRYTIFRNRLWLWKRYIARFPGFVLHDALAAGYDVVRILLVEHQKLQKLRAVARGVAAGLTKEP